MISMFACLVPMFSLELLLTNIFPHIIRPVRITHRSSLQWDEVVRVFK